MSLDSVSGWLEELKQGDDAAAERLWRRYYQQLVGVCRNKLRNSLDRVVGGEDVAVDAFDSFFRGAEEGRFPRLNDRDDLWQVLLMIASRKANDQRKRAAAKKRGGKVRGDSVFGAHDCKQPQGFDRFPGAQPTPDDAAAAIEEVGRLLDLLNDESLRQVALLKMQGYTNQEIAQQLNRTTRTVEYRLNLIRQRWERELISD